MKIAIVGSRSLDNNVSAIIDIYNNVKAWKDKYYNIEIVSGGCPTGIDRIAIEIAKIESKENNFVRSVTYKDFPADWDKYGKAAGPIRNREIVEYSDAIYVVWDGISKGSKNVIDICNELDKPYFARRF
jgi:hypothetical protein